jgi:hypothetical protein
VTACILVEVSAYIVVGVTTCNFLEE